MGSTDKLADRCPTEGQLLGLVWGSAPGSEFHGHLAECPACFARWQALLRDRAVLDGAVACAPSRRARIGSGGTILSLAGFGYRRPRAAFRSGGVPVLHSSIHPLERDYVLLELSGWDGDLELHLERGRKNGGAVSISLYMDEELTDERKLQTQLSYRLASLEHGDYQLRLQDRTVFQFNVRE